MPSLALKMLLIMAEAPAPVPVPALPDVGAPQKKKPKPILKWLQPARDYLQWKVSA
jgi:hypothetical protein